MSCPKHLKSIHGTIVRNNNAVHASISLEPINALSLKQPMISIHSSTRAQTSKRIMEDDFPLSRTGAYIKLSSLDSSKKTAFLTLTRHLSCSKRQTFNWWFHCGLITFPCQLTSMCIRNCNLLILLLILEVPPLELAAASPIFISTNFSMKNSSKDYSKVFMKKAASSTRHYCSCGIPLLQSRYCKQDFGAFPPPLSFANYRFLGKIMQQQNRALLTIHLATAFLAMHKILWDSNN